VAKILLFLNPFNLRNLRINIIGCLPIRVLTQTGGSTALSSSAVPVRSLKGEDWWLREKKMNQPKN
jgi:hypothetical protein